MSLPKLPSVEAKIEPAKTEKNYDAWFLRDCHIQANTEEAKTRLIITRYDYAQKVMGTEHLKTTKDAYEEVEKWQCWVDAIGALLNCVVLVAQEEEATRALSPLTNEKQTLQAQKVELENEKQTLLNEDPEADTSSLDAQIASLVDQIATLDEQIEALQTALDNIHTQMGPLT